MSRSAIVGPAAVLAAITTLKGLRPGSHITKDAGDSLTAEAGLIKLGEELGALQTALKKSKEAQDQQYKDLTTHYNGVKADNEEVKAAVKKHTAEYAEITKTVQTLTDTLDMVKKEMEAPIYKGGKDLEESDRKAAVELQRRAFLFKGGNEFEFKPDMNNLVKASDYRSAARKLMKAGIDSRETIIRDFTDTERKAFDAASLDAAFFSPELLGIEVDCNIVCASLLDLYSSVTVSRSAFMYPQIIDYGEIGKYDCDAKCDAELGPEGNIQFKNGRTYDFRGVFCFQRKVLAEANYDLLNFMFRAARRSYDINRNRALIRGDGINEPLGWLTADCFTKRKTGGTTFTPQDFRRFISSIPVEYGSVIPVMHQNVFGYLAATTDDVGQFIFGAGMMTYSPNDVRENMRISNCLPDATAGGTKGSIDAPFTTGDFLVAAANWNTAYYSVNKRPMFMEQYVGGSSAWCVKYQFGAEDGGFVACCPAGNVLVVGP